MSLPAPGPSTESLLDASEARAAIDGLEAFSTPHGLPSEGDADPPQSRHRRLCEPAASPLAAWPVGSPFDVEAAAPGAAPRQRLPSGPAARSTPFGAAASAILEGRRVNPATPLPTPPGSPVRTTRFRCGVIGGATFVNQYMVIRRIGRGAWSRVYLALDSRTLCLVALKIAPRTAGGKEVGGESARGDGSADDEGDERGAGGAGTFGEAPESDAGSDRDAWCRTPATSEARAAGTDRIPGSGRSGEPDRSGRARRSEGPSPPRDGLPATSPPRDGLPAPSPPCDGLWGPRGGEGCPEEEGGKRRPPRRRLGAAPPPPGRPHASPAADLIHEFEVSAAVPPCSHLLRILELIDDPSANRVALVSELLAGGAVLSSSQLARGQRVPEPLCRLYIRGTALALRALHASHVAHGDVKPQNVLVGCGGRVVLADLGCAGGFGAGDPCARTATGTPAFLAPEAAEAALLALQARRERGGGSATRCEPRAGSFRSSPARSAEGGARGARDAPFGAWDGAGGEGEPAFCDAEISPRARRLGSARAPLSPAPSLPRAPLTPSASFRHAPSGMRRDGFAAAVARDLFSLGAALHTLSRGALITEGETPEAALEEIEHGPSLMPTGGVEAGRLISGSSGTGRPGPSGSAVAEPPTRAPPRPASDPGVSPELRALAALLLQRDPERRLGLEGVLSDPWLADASGPTRPLDALLGLEGVEVRCVAAGEPAAQAGRPADCLLVVLEGQLCVVAPEASGAHDAERRLGPPALSPAPPHSRSLSVSFEPRLPSSLAPSPSPSSAFSLEPRLALSLEASLPSSLEAALASIPATTPPPTRASSPSGVMPAPGAPCLGVETQGCVRRRVSSSVLREAEVGAAKAAAELARLRASAATAAAAGVETSPDPAPRPSLPPLPPLVAAVLGPGDAFGAGALLRACRAGAPRTFSISLISASDSLVAAIPASRVQAFLRESPEACLALAEVAWVRRAQAQRCRGLARLAEVGVAAEA